MLITLYFPINHINKIKLITFGRKNNLQIKIPDIEWIHLEEIYDEAPLQEDIYDKLLKLMNIEINEVITKIIRTIFFFSLKNKIKGKIK